MGNNLAVSEKIKHKAIIRLINSISSMLPIKMKIWVTEKLLPDIHIQAVLFLTARKGKQPKKSTN